MPRSHIAVPIDRARRRLPGRRRVSVLLLTLVVSACGSQQQASTQVQTAAVKTPETIWGSSPRYLASRFPVLRRPAVGLSQKDRFDLADLEVGRIDWRQARLIPIGGPYRYWLVPGTKDLCIVAAGRDGPSRGVTCGAIAHALRHGIMYTELEANCGGRTLVGIVPDGVRRATILSKKSRTSAKVRGGAFVARDSYCGPPDRVILH
jgi:hypothetical protein